jgi:DNA modification methylase
MSIQILTGDCRDVLRALPSSSVQCCVTSPPYFGLRDYGVAGQIGLEETPDAFVAQMVEVFREVRRALRDDGTLWLNLGDSYANDGKWGGSSGGKHVAALHGATGIGRAKKHTGLKSKDLMMIPARVALALQADGWWLRSDIIWSKPNAMPESVTDRPTCAHEHVFLLTKSSKYFYDADAIRECRTSNEDARTFRGGCYFGGSIDNTETGKRKVVGNNMVGKQRGHSRRHAGFNDRWDSMSKDEKSVGGRNARNVWEIATRPFPESHFATFPPDLAERCIIAGSRRGDTVLDPFGGAGTTGLVADRLQRNVTLIELNPEYAEMARRRIEHDAGPIETFLRSAPVPLFT